MRSLYSKEVLQNSCKMSPFQQRSRLKSLKQLRQIPFQDVNYQIKTTQQKILKLLQKKLVEDNQKLQNQQVNMNNTNKSPKMFQSKHNMKEQLQKQLYNLKQQNKLFQYFEQLYKNEVPIEKVEREKVNFCENHFQQIKSKVYSKIEMNKIKLSEAKEILAKRYLQLHQYHEQKKQLETKLKQQMKSKNHLQNNVKLKLQKKSQQQFKINPLGNSGSMTLQPPSLKEKIYIMEESVNYIRHEISTIEEEIETINSKQASIREEWINFLKLFFSFGYYMSNGSDNVIEELKKMNAIIKKDDLLGDFLDENSKKYFLSYYEHYCSKDIQNNHNMHDTFSKSNGEERSRIKSTIQTKSLVKQYNLKEIYSNTRQAINNLIKHSSFRNSPQKRTQKELFLPKIQTKKQFPKIKSRVNTLHSSDHNNQKFKILPTDNIEQQRKQQIYRINHLYFGHGNQLQLKGKQMKRILFGFNVK